LTGGATATRDAQAPAQLVSPPAVHELENAVILLTGATGAIGNELLSQLTGRAHVAVLTRAKTTAHALPTPLTSARGGVVIGDLADPSLAAILRSKLPRDVTHVIHAAADVRWNAPAHVANEINVEGTRRVVRYAEDLPKLKRFCYLSTAYVCGTRAEHISELDPRPASFNNAYEASKAAAEEILETSMANALVVRPSLVLGAAASGQIARFNGLYPLLSGWNRGGLPVVIGKQDAPIDTVPVDWVARTIISLMDVGASGPVHITAGNRAPNLAELTMALGAAINMVRLIAGRSQLPALSIIDPDQYARLHDPLVERSVTRRQRTILDAFRHYEPYLKVQRTFSTLRSRQCLRDRYEAPPPLAEFIAPVVRYWWERLGELQRDGSLAP
jgi:nucleoside-diphosphate-sugar epimerase